MFKDDRMIPVLSAVVLMVAMGTVLQQADGMSWLFGGELAETRAPVPERASPSQISLQPDRVTVEAGSLVRIDVLSNDVGIGVAHRLGLAVLGAPACGRVFVQDGALQYLSDAGCVGDQQIIYAVPGPEGTLTTTLTVHVLGVPGVVAPVVEEPVIAAAPVTELEAAPVAPEQVQPASAPVLSEAPAPAQPSSPAPAPAPVALTPAVNIGTSEPEPDVARAAPAGLQAVERDPLRPPGGDALALGTGDGAARVARQTPAYAGGSDAGTATVQVPAPMPPEPEMQRVPGLDVETPGELAALPTVGGPGASPVAGGTPGDAAPVAQAPARVTAATPGLALGAGQRPVVAVAPAGPGPDPVLDRQSPGFRDPPVGSRASGRAGEWMSLAEAAAPIADNRPRGNVVPIAGSGERTFEQDLMIAVIERREPVTTPPDTPLGDLLPVLDTAASQRPSIIVRRPAPSTGRLTRASLPGADGLSSADTPDAALSAWPDAGAVPAAAPAPEEVLQPLPVPTPRQQPAPAETEVAALPPAEVACIEPPSMTLDVRRAGRTIVSLSAPCDAGAVAELRYSGLSLAMPLDAAGNGRITALGLESNAPAVLVLANGEVIDFDVPFKGMERVSRIALVWEMPVDLELNALEFGAQFGTDRHVSPLNPRSFKDVRRTGGGFLDSYRAAYGKGQNVEIYSFYQRRGGPSGVVQMLIDYASRHRDRLQETCGDGVYASPEYKVLRTVWGRPDRPILRRLAAVECSDVITEVNDNRLISGAVEDLLVTRN